MFFFATGFEQHIFSRKQEVMCVAKLQVITNYIFIIATDYIRPRAWDLIWAVAFAQQ